MSLPIQALELFAGIGGESLALKALGIHTIGYCEIDPFCQAVLQSNISRNRLHSAPIFPDVTVLKGSQFRDGGVDMIAGGFPCKGLSSLGSRKGLYGDHRSRLVTHVYRLIDELNPNYVFLENTPLIINDKNFAHLLKEFIGRDYKCAFVVLSASETGAQHQRNRWFFLAVKRHAPPLSLHKEGCKKLSNFFEQTPSSNTEPRRHKRAKCLCSAYGNTVVPAQAAKALWILNEELKLAATKKLKPTPLLSIERRYPTLALDSSTAVYQNMEYELPSSDCSGGGFNVSPPRNRGGSPTLQRMRKEFHSQCMPTPRTGVNCAVGGASMTKRTSRDPGSFLLASKETYSPKSIPSEEKKRQLAMSDEFWSVAMGFPKDWVGRPLKVLMK
uniref:DNA (cytosine-5-)-methyltransferase n=1 Tax=viral metagenome TaxID=1070528 RepID=A0A6C0C2M2_9ZZZZ